MPRTRRTGTRLPRASEEDAEDGFVRVYPSAARGDGGLSGGWRVVFCMLVVVIVLLATETVEVKILKDGANGKLGTGIGGQPVPVQPGLVAVESEQVQNDVEKGNGNNGDTAGGDSSNGGSAGAGTPAAVEPKQQTTDTHSPPRASNDAPASVPVASWTYQSRAQPISDAERARLTDEYGAWSWTDEPVKAKPEMIALYDRYPHRDVPWSDLPDDAWQKDQSYMNRFLQESTGLVERAMEAILAEYGHGKKDEPGQDFDARSAMFKLTMIPDEELMDRDGKVLLKSDNGGWTTLRSWNGLKRRILHAIVTEDSFVFAMGGHSSAAGHGNHFSQSYTLQVAWILEPIFARLGVKHQARNFGNGGLGTGHNGVAAGSIYGPDVDMLMWDSGMTERGDRDPDLMARQSIIGGIKVPVLWNFPVNMLKLINKHGNADVGAMGSSYSGIPQATKADELEDIVWAARYMRCSSDIQKDFCKPNEYNGTCWIERDDYTPTHAQQSVPGGRASWHPGNRFHQLQGRTLAFTILSALHEVLQEWNALPGYTLQDHLWHVSTYYATIRDKVMAIPAENSPCHKLADLDLHQLCVLPMKARTEFSPRAYPDKSSIRAIMPKEQRELINDPPEVVYQPPDVLNPRLHPPPGEVDVLNIVANGPPFRPVSSTNYDMFYDSTVTGLSTLTQKPGKGHYLNHPSGFCDGSLDSFCNRGPSAECLLKGHNDSRSGILMNSLSGWLLFNIPKLKNGLVVVKLETWHWQYEIEKTKDWTSINNENDGRRLEEDATPIMLGDEKALQERQRHRMLGKLPQEKYCDEFRFEISVNGKVESLDSAAFTGDTAAGDLGSNDGRRKHWQRVVELVPLVNDPDLTGGVEKDVQIGIRMVGCKTFKVNHVYWS